MPSSAATLPQRAKIGTSFLLFPTVISSSPIPRLAVAMRISAFPVVLSLALYASARHNHFAAARNVRRDDPDPSGYASQPISQGDADNGYAGLPAVANANTIMEFPLSVTDGATIVRVQRVQ